MVEFVLSCMQQTISRTVKSEIAKGTANKESSAANALTVQQAEGSVKSSLFCCQSQDSNVGQCSETDQIPFGRLR